MKIGYLCLCVVKHMFVKLFVSLFKIIFYLFFLCVYHSYLLYMNITITLNVDDLQLQIGQNYGKI